ncbi:MAG: hypothetical protein LBJ17_05260 [Dysgonamonadaceae bacterium]|jgi:asparagine N-glycosylation enzyme membrane subunit Stt3|nr:hypothetical protein [Dysgonamonadaceae bacterium]
MSEKLRNMTFYCCAVLVLISVALYITGWKAVPYIYAVSGAGVSVYYLTSTYSGENRRLRRLNFQQVIAALLLPVSSYLMFKHRNDWFLALFVSAVLQIYIVTVRRHEEKKNNGNNYKSAK